MSHRPLVFVSGLTVGDYLLWNWSLNGSHDVLALVSGLTLPPLAVACVWLLALSAGRLVGRYGRRSSARTVRAADVRARGVGGAQAPTAGASEDVSSSTGSAGRSPGRLAA
ncbi:MAG: hypothetical protein JWO23_977 [Solirubrobacterales bacterium]|nr:hypothetical protein [Solirubrobacterales bacterium]